jgi:predicted glycosyltransferase
LFKHAIRLLERDGNDCAITCSKKDVLLDLLDAGGYPYTLIGNFSSTLWGKMIEQVKVEKRLYQKVREFAPDILIGGPGGVTVAHVGKLAGLPSVVFDDTEHARIEHTLMDPFVSTICTPSSYRNDLGEKQIRYNGYHDLAYLHPNRFTPNPAVLNEIGLTPGDPYIIIRLVSWDASHDRGHHGIHDRVGLVKALEPYGQILITSEGPLQPELENYRIRVSPEKMHDLLYYATLYVGEGGTMASEAATLGTHAIHISTTAKYCGTFHDLNQYELLWTTENDEETMNKAIELLRNSHLKDEGKGKRERLNNDKIDVTAFIIWFIENYPDSIRIMKVNPDFQNTFKSTRSL